MLKFLRILVSSLIYAVNNMTTLNKKGFVFVVLIIYKSVITTLSNIKLFSLQYSWCKVSYDSKHNTSGYVFTKVLN